MLVSSQILQVLSVEGAQCEVYLSPILGDKEDSETTVLILAYNFYFIAMFHVPSSVATCRAILLHQPCSYL